MKIMFDYQKVVFDFKKQRIHQILLFQLTD